MLRKNTLLKKKSDVGDGIISLPAPSQEAKSWSAQELELQQQTQVVDCQLGVFELCDLERGLNLSELWFLCL